MVRTRSAAAALADSGRVRVNGARIDAASRPVKPGDVVTIAFDRVRILKVLGFSERRGGADSVAGLCEDLTPPAEPPQPSAVERIAGNGRPTKRERRAMDRLLGRDES